MRGLMLIAGVLALCPACLAQEEAVAPSEAREAPEFFRVRPDFNHLSGENLANYPPSPLVDYLHMRLEIDIPDMNTPRASAVQALDFTPVGAPVRALELDAVLLAIDSVMLAEVGEDGAAGSASPGAFEHDGKTLSLSFDPPLRAGTRYRLTTAYRIDDPARGLWWTPESSEWPGRPAQLYSQGASEFSGYWFPCHDYPNDRLTTELVVTVPVGYTVSSNGRLLGESKGVASGQTAGGTSTLEGRATFHWLQDQSHVNYLVTLIVGKFDVVDVGTDVLPMPVYVPLGQGERIAGTFARTPAMVDLYAKLFDEPFPWDRYAQLAVHNFDWGGMENTGATTMFDGIALAKGLEDEFDQDDLMSHELAHQWFGDLLTCRSWEDIWLNEGFATYAENLWFEHRFGPDAYFAGVRAHFDAVIRSDKAAAPYQAAMVSKTWGHPDEVFDREANPYQKGSAVLHMLRTQLGDEVFFRGIRAYVDRHKFGVVETGDLRRVLEQTSGESLERFFRQWCERPGVPVVEVGLEYSTQDQAVHVTIRQAQPIDGYNPAFAFAMPIRIEAGGAVVRRVIEVDSRETTATVSVTGEPDMVCVDPALAVLADLRVTQPAAWWTRQLLRGPTLAARVQAARALAGDDSREAALALWATVIDARLHDSLRNAAIHALRDRGDPAWMSDLIVAQIEDPHVRATAVAAVATAAASHPILADGAKAYFVQRLAHDPSLRVRSEAVAGLAALGATDQTALLTGLCALDSQFDQLRQYSLRALAELDAPAGLEVAARLAGEGNHHRTRPVAIQALRRLAHHNPEAAYAAISRQLTSRERTVWEAAGRALVELADARGIGALETLASRVRDPVDRTTVENWIGALEDKTATR